MIYSLEETRRPIRQTRLKEGSISATSRFTSDLDLVGLIERARFGFLPLSLAARYGISRLIDSRNCYELIQRGFVIPRSNNNHERIRTLDEIIAKDKGGMIFSPKIGLHENVMVLDYENEYANLILKHNLSYETITSTEDGRIMLNTKGQARPASNRTRKCSQETNIFQEFTENACH